MRVDKQESSFPSDHSFRNLKAGSLIRGKVSKSGNKTFLIQSQGKKIQVIIDGKYSENDREFVIIENKKIPLIKALKNNSNKRILTADLKSSLSSSIKFDPAEKASRILSGLGVSINAGINQKISQMINDEISSNQLYRILLQLMDLKSRNYFKAMVDIWQKYFKKKAKENKNFTDNIAKGYADNGESFKKSKLIVNEILKMISSIGVEQSENEPVENADSRIMSFLYFMMQNREEAELLPFFILGNKKKGNSFWIFTEFNLSEIGNIRLALRQKNKIISGCIYCDIEKKELFKQFIEFENIEIIEVLKGKEDIIEWPFRTIWEFAGDAYDKLA
ncbi:MAG: hypothetical protein KAR07_04180 [Spirochaetes bacterium]|nr:hypothetical protein [Spirochaetota bacterium]